MSIYSSMAHGVSIHTLNYRHIGVILHFQLAKIFQSHFSKTIRLILSVILDDTNLPDYIAIETLSINYDTSLTRLQRP